MVPPSLDLSRTIDRGRVDFHSMTILSNRTGTSKFSCSVAIVPFGPIVDIHAVPVLPSFTLAIECVDGLHTLEQSVVPWRQKFSPAEQSESVCTVLPLARLPIGGKQPIVLLHCAWETIG